MFGMAMSSSRGGGRALVLRNLIDGSAPFETGFRDTEGALAVRELSFQGLDQCLAMGPIRATASVPGPALTIFRSKPIQ